MAVSFKNTPASRLADAQSIGDNLRSVPLAISHRKSVSKRDIFEKECTPIAALLASYSGTASSITVNQVLATAYARGTGGSNLRINFVKIKCNKDCTLRWQVNNVGGLLNLGPIANINLAVKANTDYTLEVNREVPWGAQINFLYIGDMTDTTGTFTMSVYHDSFQFTQTNDFLAPYAIMGWGDSIMFGANANIDNTNPNTSYYMQIVNHYKANGFRVKPIHKGRYAGATADQLAIASRYGDLDQDNVSLILMGLGMNTSPSDAAFTASINELINYKNVRYTNVPMVVLGPTTRLDASEAVMVRYRNILSGIVDGLDPSLFSYLDLSLGYTGGAAANGVTSGDVHPNQVGHNNLAAYLIDFLNANNINLILNES